MRSLLVFVVACAASASDWQAAGPFGGSVLSVAIDPHGAMLAGTRNGQLFQSADQGKNWRQLSFGRFLTGNVQVLAIDANASGHYWAGIGGENTSSNGIWESRDAGQSWTQSLAGLSVESIALFPAETSTVAVGTRQGLYVRRAGRPWQRITPVDHKDLQDIVSLAFDPQDENTLYAGTPHLPWKTIDGGKTWTSIHSGIIDDSDVFSLHVSRVDPERVFASACSGIYRSLDAGKRWTFLDGIPSGSRRTHVILEDSRNPNYVYAGTTMGLFRSSDGGKIWTRLGSAQVNSIALDPADEQTIYIATEHSGLHVSHDRGKTLQPISNGIHARNVTAVAHLGSLLYVGTSYEGSEGGVFVGSRTGWRRVGSAAAFSAKNVRAIATDGKRMFAAANGGLFQSINSGSTWTAAAGKFPADIQTLAFVNGELWIGARTGLYRKSGTVWTRNKTIGAAPVLDIQTSGKRILLRSDLAAWTSGDQGTTWLRLSEPALFGAALSCEGTALLASSSRLTISKNGEAPHVVEGIPEGTVSAVAFHPFDCRQAYAVQFGRLFRSNDGGAHWSAMEDGASLPSVSRLWISESNADVLFAATQGSGVFTRNIRAIP